MDFDYLYRNSPQNTPKLGKVADLLQGALTQPFPSLSTVYRIRRMEPMLQVDLTANIHGVKSFNSLRSRAERVHLNGHLILVASLADIIKSKKEANRPQDQAVLHVLEATLEQLGKETPQADQA